MTPLLGTMRFPFRFLAFGALSFFAVGNFKSAAQTAEERPIVSIAAGQIRGRQLANGRAEFLGIPFAERPIGDLRWHEPLPPKPWSGVRDAGDFGPPCAQNIYGEWNKHDADTSKEDCLYLNVMTPEWPVKHALPVMFWLHGGANTGGTASSHLYKDGTLVEHGVILVTTNYRLGIFGFFSHPELTSESPHHSSGNYALLDQIAALKWVHDNIAKFGGDPKNVTIFGQSAGASDLGLLMTSPLAKGFFQRAIAESGTVFSAHDALPLAEAEQEGVKIADGLSAPKKDGLKYLRGLPVTSLLEAARPSANGRGFPTPAVIDGWVFEQLPPKVFAVGQEAPIPLVIGNNTREFDIPTPVADLRKWISAVYGDLAPKALAAYGLANGGQGDPDPFYGSTAGQWSADLIFRCPATAIAAWHHAAHHPTYEYQFERAIPGQEANGSVHSADLPYVFGFYPKTGNISGPFGEIDYKIADLIEKYWTNFARTGNPNGNDLPTWPQYDDAKHYVSFTEDGQVVAKTALREAQCGIFRERLKRQASP